MSRDITLPEKFYLAASIILVASGISHNLVVDVFRGELVKIENQAQIINVLEQTTITIFGGTMKFDNAFNAYSIAFGLLLTSFGAINLILWRAKISFDQLKNIIAYEIFILVFLFTISLFWLFYLPTLTLLLSFLFLMGSYFIED